MTDKHHVALDKARKAAKALARSGEMTHQQALDRIAREAGHPHWNAMASVPDASAAPARGPMRLFSELETFDYLRKPEEGQVHDLAAVETATRRLMEDPSRRAGLRIGEWVSGIMREAARKALPGRKDVYGHRIRELPLDAAMVGQALDPKGAPHEGDELLVRCPLHDDTTPSLRITGAGSDLRIACMAGCRSTDLQDRLISRLAEDSAAALAFMRANDRSKVVEGWGHGRPGVGGAGGTYRLADGTSHSLDILSCRMLTDGYPNWYDGKVPRSVAALERRLRVALAGNFPIVVEAPEDRARGLWRFLVAVGRNGGYRILVTMRQGEQAGLNAGHNGRFSVSAAETFEEPARAVARAVELTRSFETVDPAERAANEVRHAREVARDERLRGTVNGWGWWAGPNEDEFTWGGPWKTRQEAISAGNGHCEEEGDVFYVVQARVEDEEPDADHMVRFEETRGLKRCRAT
jgi:hypothetical protein